MIGIIEKQVLERKSLSFQAKYLYMFILRQNAILNNFKIDILSLCEQMICTSRLAAFSPLPKHINALLHELYAHRLIAVSNYTNTLNFNGKSISLPYFQNSSNVTGKPFFIFYTWQPSNGFYANAIACGLNDCNYSQEDLHDFISYWSNRAEQRNQSGWERAFISRLLRKRQASAVSNKAATRSLAAQVPNIKAQKTEF